MWCIKRELGVRGLQVMDTELLVFSIVSFNAGVALGLVLAWQWRRTRVISLGRVSPQTTILRSDPE